MGFSNSNFPHRKWDSYLVSRYTPHEAYPYIEPNVRFSRIRLPTKLIIHSCLINTDIYLRSCQWIDLQHIIECLPCVAYFLATPIEPIKETSLNSIPKAVYGSEIVSYAVIVIVPNKYLIQSRFLTSQYPDLSLPILSIKSFFRKESNVRWIVLNDFDVASASSCLV